jgi:hypothetical protein
MSSQELKQVLIHGSPKIALNAGRYDAVVEAKPSRGLVYEGVLESETGDAFYVEAGQVIRMEQRHERTQDRGLVVVQSGSQTVAGAGEHRVLPGVVHQEVQPGVVEHSRHAADGHDDRRRGAG